MLEVLADQLLRFPNLRLGNGYTWHSVLEELCFRGNLETLKFLESVDPPFPDFSLTSLHVNKAAQAGHLDVVQWIWGFQPPYGGHDLCNTFSCCRFSAEEIMNYLRSMAIQYDLKREWPSPEFTYHAGKVIRIEFTQHDPSYNSNDHWQGELDKYLDVEADYDIERDKTYKAGFK